MPCASVSENPTRVSDANLKGGLRSVTRPSSSSMGTHAKPASLREPCGKRREALPTGPRQSPVTEIGGDAPSGEAEENKSEDREGDDRIDGADLPRAWLLHARGSVVGRATR